MRFFRNFFIFLTNFKFGTGTQNWILIHIAGSKSGFRDDLGQYEAKTIFLCSFSAFFGQTPLRNSVDMATPKIPGDQKLYERVCYMLKLNVTQFHLPRPKGF